MSEHGRDDTPAIQAAIAQAREHPGEAAEVAGTDITVTWTTTLVPGTAIETETISFSPGVLHLGGVGKQVVEFTGNLDPAGAPIWNLP